MLHSNLNTYLSENCSGDVCILSAVQWINDNAQTYITKSVPISDPKKEEVLMQSKEIFTRLWIYSHHIYNKIKRKNILEWARELNLSGFSMPGKPGIVCVEGLQSACNEFWARYVKKNVLTKSCPHLFSCEMPSKTFTLWVTVPQLNIRITV